MSVGFDSVMGGHHHPLVHLVTHPPLHVAPEVLGPVAWTLDAPPSPPGSDADCASIFLIRGSNTRVRQTNVWSYVDIALDLVPRYQGWYKCRKLQDYTKF